MNARADARRPPRSATGASLAVPAAVVSALALGWSPPAAGGAAPERPRFIPTPKSVTMDEGVKVWLNGKVLYGANVERPPFIPDRVKVSLKEGPNPLLMKVLNFGGGWEARARVKGLDGKVLSGLEVKAAVHIEEGGGRSCAPSQAALTAGDEVVTGLRVKEKTSAGARPPSPGESGGAARLISPKSDANLVANGGFEADDPRGGLAESWNAGGRSSAPSQTPLMAGEWGGRAMKYSVRVSKTEFHGGARSIVIRVLSEGAKPGITTDLGKVSAGSYEVLYWACCDPGGAATVAESFAGKLLHENTVGGEWKRFTETVGVEKDSRGAELRIWTGTQGVRVYVDDVEVRAAK